MTTVKNLAVVALLFGAMSFSLAMAQNGPATGGQPPAAQPSAAAPAPPGPGVNPQPAAPGPNLQSAAPAPGAPSRTRVAHHAPRPHARIFMSARHMIPGCAVGQPATATCACGTAASGGPMLCQTGQWCHYPMVNVCTQ
ncbi:MAG: hypothetical protein J2P55_02775 [Rhizobiales bacterium]|nr:hypothetical protein [Hyphomicrobiales bacterium]